ncbi:hypothetical protein CCC_01381 [Paramagnetospirillum magnetotacticum MS-1]|uniref:Uncharacterized protein n=1 Tax=Paramagnetospirillum magnetotacticum MS-1 TaxID=272627 RepID=A0A0C2YP51_PARME|nr:hypothetical protein CCC_01381 [Paramagnetospirillum magnetotacticum MS-1]
MPSHLEITGGAKLHNQRAILLPLQLLSRMENEFGSIIGGFW